MLSRILFAIALAAAAAAASAAAPLTIYGVDEPPASYPNEKGKALGVTTDIVQEIQRRVGTKDPVQIVPETVALDSAKTKPNVVSFSFSRTAEREPQYLWVAQVIRKPWELFASKASGLQVASLDDMRKLPSIGVVDGDVRAKYLQKEGFTNLVVAADPAENIGNLLAGKVKTIFYEPAGVAYYCHKNTCPPDSVVNIYSPRSSDVYILMSKGTDPATVKAWQDAVAAMKKDGTWEQILKKWVIKAAMDFGVDSAVNDGVLVYK